MDTMTRKVTIELSDKVAASAEADRLGTEVSDVVERALIRELGWAAVARIQARNSDLGEEEAMKLAYEELRAYRKERDSA